MSDQHTETGKSGWFDKKGRVQGVLWAVYGISALLLTIDFILWFLKVDKHPYLEWETWPGFYAAFGFVSCVVLVFGARFVLRPIAKRREDFYVKKGDNNA